MTISPLKNPWCHAAGWRRPFGMLLASVAVLAACLLWGAADAAAQPTAPGTPVLTASDDGIEVEWTAPTQGAPLTEYTVQWRQANAAAWDSTTFSPLPADIHDLDHAHYFITEVTAVATYEVRVAAHNAGGRGPWSSATVAVTVVPTTPDPNRPPVFAAGLATTAELQEQYRIPGYIVATVTATDPDGDPVSYSRHEDSTSGLQVNDNGAITVRDSRPLVLGQSYPIIVVATDDRGASSEFTLTVTVIENQRDQKPADTQPPPPDTGGTPPIGGTPGPGPGPSEPPAAPVGVLENPGSFQSGVSLISGWVCEADTVHIELTHGPSGSIETYRAGYGTIREDTQGTCGDSDNGFGLLWNWNRLGDGTHTVRALADGVAIGVAQVSVTTLGEEFARGLSGRYAVAAFPSATERVHLHWSQARQNFVLGPPTPPTITGRSWPGDPQTGLLENPAPSSLQSGVSVISGWVCEAEVVEIELTNETSGAVETYRAATGTIREDTLAICGDSNTGFGLLWNWNRLGDGAHTVRALADGVEIGQARVLVTTLGEEFARGLEGTAELADFPSPGETVTVAWQAAQQNFVIVGRE